MALPCKQALGRRHVPNLNLPIVRGRAHRNRGSLSFADDFSGTWELNGPHATLVPAVGGHNVSIFQVKLLDDALMQSECAEGSILLFCYGLQHGGGVRTWNLPREASNAPGQKSRSSPSAVVSRCRSAIHTLSQNSRY